VRLTVEPAVLDPPPALTAALVRVLNEALTNAVKHAAAGAVEVRLTAPPGTIAIAVADDGRGFDPGAAVGAGHLGLSLMRGRAAEAGGDLDVRSEVGAGTTVAARFPLPSPL
jgi:signal transduction histidine kinase